MTNVDQDLAATLEQIALAVTKTAAKSFAPLAPMASTQGFVGQVLAPRESSGVNPAITQLQMRLYEHCYVSTFSGTEFPAGAPARTVARMPQTDDMVGALADANASREHWNPGWQIREVLTGGQIMTCKGGLSRMAWPGGFMTHGMHGIAPYAGLAVSLLAPKESGELQPGFYFAFGEALLDQQSEYDMVRFYWNVTEAGAVPLTRLLTQTLNRFEVPFRFKCLAHHSLFPRTDAAVLYVSKRFYRITADLLLDIHREVASLLGESTPLFTRRLAKGLAFAEDPGSGESFGMSRCRILAEGLWNCHTHGVEGGAQSLSEIAQQFSIYGIDLDRPYLNPQSCDQYRFPGEWA